MIFDKQNLICDNVALVTTATTTSQLGDAIDLWAGSTTQPNVAAPQGINGPIGGPVSALISRLNEVEVYAQVNTEVLGAATATVQLQLVVGDDATLSSPVVLKETAALAVNAATPSVNMPAGTIFKITGDIGAIPVGKRFLGVKQVTGGTGALTQGKITVGIVADFQTVHGASV